MASYRYERDIQPGDLKPRREKQYTRKERWANWWDYNLKWVILIGIAVAFVAYNFIGQYFFTTKADYNVAVVAPYYLPEDTVNALQTQLAQFGEDRNGDGKVVVTLNVYTLDYSDEETQTESAAYLTMAGTTKLAADVQGGLSAVFLLYDPAGFEESTGTLRYLDGSLPEPGSDGDWWNMVYRWTDCPALTGLDLGEYQADTTHAQGGDSQEYMAQFYVGMRGAWNSGTADNLKGGEDFWQALTAGAVSTASAEDCRHAVPPDQAGGRRTPPPARPAAPGARTRPAPRCRPRQPPWPVLREGAEPGRPAKMTRQKSLIRPMADETLSFFQSKI